MKHSCSAMIAAAALLAAPTAPADPVQGPTAIYKAVEDYVRVQSTGLPGEVTVTVGTLDSRLALPACTALAAFMPAGARLWGNTSVGVRCASPVAWQIYVPVKVRVIGNYVASGRPLAPGQTLGAADLVVLSGDLTQLPAGITTDPAQAVGKTLASPLAAGQPLRLELLRAPLVIQQGQSVKLVSEGSGFHVSAEGRALTNAAEGQVAQVRTPSGQTVSGIARSDGTVQVRF